MLEKNSLEEKIERLDLLEQRIKKCTKCPLCDERKNAIIGSGTFKASLLIVRDFPEYEEDRTGNAWSSPLGRLFEKLLCASNIYTNRIYGTYLVHCRPPDNKLIADDITACKNYLTDIINIIDPAIIAICGRKVLHYFLGANKKILDTHGNFYRRYIFGKSLLIYPLIHPAGMIKFPSSKKFQMFSDLKVLFNKMVELELKC